MAKSEVTIIQAGNHKLEVTKVVDKRDTRYVIRLENGYALSLGATERYKDIIIKDVEEGKYDEYIARFCKK